MKRTVTTLLLVGIAALVSAADNCNTAADTNNDAQGVQ